MQLVAVFVVRVTVCEWVRKLPSSCESILLLHWRVLLLPIQRVRFIEDSLLNVLWLGDHSVLGRLALPILYGVLTVCALCRGDWKWSSRRELIFRVLRVKLVRPSLKIVV